LVLAFFLGLRPVQMGAIMFMLTQISTRVVRFTVMLQLYNRRNNRRLKISEIIAAPTYPLGFTFKGPGLMAGEFVDA
jgi:hypothetical protein